MQCGLCNAEMESICIQRQCTFLVLWANDCELSCGANNRPYLSTWDLEKANVYRDGKFKYLESERTAY